MSWIKPHAKKRKRAKSSQEFTKALAKDDMDDPKAEFGFTG